MLGRHLEVLPEGRCVKCKIIEHFIFSSNTTELLWRGVGRDEQLVMQISLEKSSV